MTFKEVSTFKIINVAPDSQAEKCGLVKNDIILKVNSIYVNDITETILKHKIGDKIDLTILRDSKEITKEVILGSIRDNYKVDAILLLANYYNIKETTPKKHCIILLRPQKMAVQLPCTHLGKSIRTI
jgi:predicted metalloprotease with PDZ domain